MPYAANWIKTAAGAAVGGEEVRVGLGYGLMISVPALRTLSWFRERKAIYLAFSDLMNHKCAWPAVSRSTLLVDCASDVASVVNQWIQQEKRIAVFSQSQRRMHAETIISSYGTYAECLFGNN